MRYRNLFFIPLITASLLRPDDSAGQWIHSADLNGIVLCSVASGPDLYAGSWGGCVFHSADGGDTWNAIAIGATNAQVRSLALIGPVLYAGTLNGVYPYGIRFRGSQKTERMAKVR